MVTRPLPLTAWSAVNALGRSTAEVLDALDAGRSGLRPPELALPFETFVGAVPGPLAPLPDAWARYDCRLARIAWLAFEDVRDAVLRAADRWGPRRVAVILGTSTGGLHATEDAYFTWRADGAIPDRFDFHRQHDFNALGELLAASAGLTGPIYTVSTACSSSGKGLGAARRLIDAGRIDAAVIGGVDSLCRMTLQGFHGLGVLSSRPCRPFSSERDGINIGEGAAFQLVERDAPNAAVHVLGVGETSDAHHMSSPHPEGKGAAAAMAQALDHAGLAPDDVDYLNAHGTSTVLNDAAEGVAIRTLFGDRVPVASTKGYTGHLLGAAGGTELTFVAHAVATGRIPANLNHDPLPEDLGLDVVTAPRLGVVRRALSNSFAFGGSNVSVLVGAPS